MSKSVVKTKIKTFLIKEINNNLRFDKLSATTMHRKNSGNAIKALF